MIRGQVEEEKVAEPVNCTGRPWPFVTGLTSVPNRTSNTVDKSRYRIPQRLIWFKLIG